MPPTSDPPQLRATHWVACSPLEIKSPVLSTRDCGVSTGLTRTNTLFALSRHAQVYWLPGFPRPERLHGALYRIIGPALGALAHKIKNPLTIRGKRVQKVFLVCLSAYLLLWFRTTAQ